MKFIDKWMETSLVLKIVIGLIIGAILGVAVPQWSAIGFLGDLFVSILKAIAPILVFVLVVSAISMAKSNVGQRFRNVLILYLVATFLAAVVGVVGSFIYPVSIHLTGASAASAPQSLGEIVSNLLLSIFSNPIDCLSKGEYLGILFWASIFGFALKTIASDATKKVIGDIADAVTRVVQIIIQFAPIGIMGLVFTSVSESGIGIFAQYGELILLFVVCFLVVIFITNPLLVAFVMRRNPFPLLLICLRESGITAFFSRSSAANIPINMSLCERLGLDKDLFSISIPLGATINTGGAAITITVMTLAVCHTLGIHVYLPLAFILCIISAFGACGASGVVGGSLLLIPMGCSVFGISADISMQAVAVGFIISVIQDSFETALNSSADPFFSAAVDYRNRANNDEPVNYLGEFAK